MTMREMPPGRNPSDNDVQIATTRRESQLIARARSCQRSCGDMLAERVRKAGCVLWLSSEGRICGLHKIWRYGNDHLEFNQLPGGMLSCICISQRLLFIAIFQLSQILSVCNFNLRKYILDKLTVIIDFKIINLVRYLIMFKQVYIYIYLSLLNNLQIEIYVPQNATQLPSNHRGLNM